MSEYLSFALDIGAYFLFSHLEARLKDNLYEIRDGLPSFQSFSDAKEALLKAEDHEIPYAQVSGKLEPVGQPLNTMGREEKAVLKVTEKFSAYRVRDPNNAAKSETFSRDRLGSRVENVPCVLALNRDARYANDAKLWKMQRYGKVVQVADMNSVGNNLADEAVLVSKKFEPKEQCLTSYELSKIKFREGTLVAERIIRCGAPVTAFGRLTWDAARKEVTVGRPTTPRHRFLLTGDVDAVMAQLEDERHGYNVARRLCILVGVMLLYLASDRLYKDFKEWRNKRRRGAEF